MIKRLFKSILIIGVAVGAIAALIVAQVQFEKIDAIAASPDMLQPAPVAIVLGASVKLDGTPSDALYDRVITAIDLYHAGKAGKLLMTGDDGEFHVNEVEAMARIARESGIPEEDILIDGHGYRTYESCKRAVQVYDVRSAIIVTQRFHLGRALYLCDHFDMQVQGLPADRRPYKDIIMFTLRDLAASLKAWWDLNIVEPASPVADFKP